MKLSVLMATMNEGTAGLAKRVEALDEQTELVVCRQITKELNNKIDLKDELESVKKGIVFINKNEKGLSKSRNFAMDAVNDGICLITDDDVSFEPHLFDAIKEAYDIYPDADIITFQAKTPEGEFFKTYSASPFAHNIKSVAKVSSIEMTFRIKSIRNSNIKFDERFGLGTQYPTGEEFVFLTDALKKGLKVYFYPKILAIHPKESSGSILDEKMFIAKGAMFARVFGFRGYIVSLLFAIKKYSMYKNKFGLATALSRSIDGAKSILKN